MREIKNHYFKESPVQLISGLPLPKDKDGVVRNIRFIECDFHPNCFNADVQFENCEFKNCDLPWADLKKGIRIL